MSYIAYCAFLGLIALTSANVQRDCFRHRCEQGQRCIMPDVQCARAPCPSIPTCVPADHPVLIKPGTCPEQGGIGICVVQCFGDDSCPGEEKCCGNCPKACTPPAEANNTRPEDCSTHRCGPGQRCVMEAVRCFRAPCPSFPTCVDIPATSDKPGTCPAQTGIGICIAQCTNDDSCPGPQKCCGSCPRACRYPVEVIDTKPGRCPPRLLNFLGGWCKNFESTCAIDEHCLGGHKCCDTGCGLKCQRPILDTPAY